MFNLIDIGKRAGSGIPNIYRIWDKQGWEPPVIVENFELERITLSLSIGTWNQKETIKGDEKVRISDLQKKKIKEYLTDHSTAKTSEPSQLLGVKNTKMKNLIQA